MKISTGETQTFHQRTAYPEFSALSDATGWATRGRRYSWPLSHPGDPQSANGKISPNTPISGMTMTFIYLWLLVAAPIICRAHESAIPSDKQIPLMDFAAKYGLDEEGVAVEIQTMLEAASTLRGAPCTIQDVISSQRLVFKICFPDLDCWAAKWGHLDDRQEIVSGIKALTLVEQYCPNIPATKLKGWNMGNYFIHYFTEWAEGEGLRNRSNLTQTREVVIPHQVITSLAEFVFNLSTCMIPSPDRIFPKSNFF